jgi:hypothetical protein
MEHHMVFGSKQKKLNWDDDYETCFFGATYFQSNAKYDEMGICTWVK